MNVELHVRRASIGSIPQDVAWRGKVNCQICGDLVYPRHCWNSTRGTRAERSLRVCSACVALCYLEACLSAEDKTLFGE